MYYEARPQTPSKPVVFHLKWKDTRFTFTTDAGVFSKGELDPGTRLLLTALPLPLQGSLLIWDAAGGLSGSLQANCRPALPLPCAILTSGRLP